VRARFGDRGLCAAVADFVPFAGAVPYLGATVLAARSYPTTATSGTVAGLTDGQTYTFKVFATNAIGQGMLSVPTAPVTIGAPAAPTSPSAIPGNGNATVRWAPPATSNGSRITGYRVTPTSGSSRSHPSPSRQPRPQVSSGR
jgi:hypothetical protein